MSYQLKIPTVAKIKKTIASVSKNVEKLEPSIHCWWECEMVQPLWKTVWQFLNRLNIELAYDQKFHSYLYIQDKWNLCLYTCILMFIIATKQKQSKCPSIDECISKVWCIHATEYYLSKKRNEVLYVLQTLKTSC